MSKKSIDHYEALLQEFTEHPERAVELVRELSRQSNELEDEVQKLKRQREYLIKELTSGEDDGDAYCPLPAWWDCIHQGSTGWGCNSCREDRNACWIKAMEVYEV